MKILRNLFIALMLIFLYAPLLVMTFFSFNSSKSTSVFEGFSLRWYEQLLYDSESILALQNTLILAILSAVIATVLGTVAAVGIFNMKNKALKATLTSVTNIPMMTPEIVTGVSLMLLFVFMASIIGKKEALGFGTILCAHITFNLPYVILNVMPKLRQTDVHLSEAAEDLGCTPLKAFFKVILPAIYPGIFTGFIMSFTLSLDDFVISYFTSGPSFQTLPIRIYSMTKKTVKPTMYPTYEEAKTVESTVEIMVQVNGKNRATISIGKEDPKDQVISVAKEAIADKLNGTIVKEIYVPGRLVNIVIKPN